ncbi:MAG: PolC-type DNA polymerase III [Tissierellia bacterium]|nr:PolC-type DNA polymerase III [Tissierellia bacterium]
MSESADKLLAIFERNDIEINLDIDTISVEGVHITNNDKALHILLASEAIVREEVLEELEAVIGNRFRDWQVRTRIRYRLPGQPLDTIKEYWDNIVYFIGKEIPSSISWIEDLEWELADNTLLISVHSDVIHHILTTNKMENRIQDKIRDELGMELTVYLDDSKIIDNDDSIIKRKNKEEKKLSTDVLNDINGNGNGAGGDRNAIGRHYVLGDRIAEAPISINTIDMDTGMATICGEVFEMDVRDIKGNRKLVIFNITDLTDSITVKVFLTQNQFKKFQLNVRDGSYVKVSGNIIYDNYSKFLVLMMKSLNVLEKHIRMDSKDIKRVELHAHTQMSSMDGVISCRELIKRAKKWNHNAIAITDHGVVQGFPEAMRAGNDFDIKVIYGMEGYLVDDERRIVYNCNVERYGERYVVFDLETTGLSPMNDMIIEIGAVKIEDGVIVDEFSQLINPGRPIPLKIVNITGITDTMVEDKPKIHDVLPSFYEFIQDSVLVAHNAVFDMGFLRKQLSNIDREIENPVLDTLELAKSLFPHLKRHRLDVIAKHLDVDLINHHRAVDDARATANIFLKCLDILKDDDIDNLEHINRLIGRKDISRDRAFHVIILVKNIIGLKNLYKMVSESHLNYFHRQPKIPKSLLRAHREGLIIGSACESGELYRAILENRDENAIGDIIDFYDYLEVQPIANNMHLIRDGLLRDEEQLREINRDIVRLGERFQKKVIATGDVHFLDPEDDIYRKILMFGKRYSDAEHQPPLFFKTTGEMLEEFEYLGREKAEEIVITNTNMISDKIERIVPIPAGTYPPVIEGAEEDLQRITYDKAIEIYGDPLPKIVKERLDKELDSIIKNGYAVMYIIAQRLVWKSIEDGYLVGSRGSVGSSFVATMSGITEVNPLVPHYICPNCKYSEFIVDGSIGSGIDLPDKACPKCHTILDKDGHDIPFEVFLGFEGDKEPDIDLNFAGEYQPRAHRYTEQLFGVDNVFRAGTIGTIADKTAFGFVRKYLDENQIMVHPAEINRLVRGCTGVKRTSGQHPGGVMIVPDDKDIHDFSPIQYPANDREAGVITTHFDYDSISGRILKLDILGHDVPTMIRMLEGITGVNYGEIPLDDEKTMQLFTGIEPLDIREGDIDLRVGTLGIPEFGTKFVRQMLIDTKPTTFADLVRISGLSHGTDVWLNNAQDLVRSGKTTLSQVISTRDDIMLYLIYSGLDEMIAFNIMERVRRGRGLTEDDEREMRSFGVPEWYIESCNKIKYMFPKAHAVAYVTMSFRIAYFKVHHPEAFYATYFTTKAQDFDANLVLQGNESVKGRMRELRNLSNKATAKERNLLTVLEVVEEMYARGFQFERVDLYRSDSDKFLIGNDGILPPFKSLDGLGENAAKQIVEERNKSKFISIEDLVSRTRITRPALEALREHNCLEDLPESNQMSIFNL